MIGWCLFAGNYNRNAGASVGSGQWESSDDGEDEPQLEFDDNEMVIDLAARNQAGLFLSCLLS